MLERSLGKEIIKKLRETNKVILLYGARQVGKTTLSKSIIQQLNYTTTQINGDNPGQIRAFEDIDLKRMLEIIDGSELLFIDEAQNIINIGESVKLLHDEYPNLKIILTGSSSLELTNTTQESLAGRKRTLELYPLSIEEIRKENSIFEIKEDLDNILKYGLYPEVYSLKAPKDKKETLLELMNSYLYKDILQLAEIKNPRVLRDLVKLLALQIGQTVSVNKLANALNVSHETVTRYIDLLEKSFVVFRLRGYSKNLSKEISKMDKIYFYDTGIRNIVINQFSPMNERVDNGNIWENFIISERRKFNSYQGKFKEYYFWRTYTGAEIDYIEEEDGKLEAFEIKFNKSKKNPPVTWKETYPNSSFETINLDSWTDFVL